MNVVSKTTLAEREVKTLGTPEEEILKYSITVTCSLNLTPIFIDFQIKKMLLNFILALILRYLVCSYAIREAGMCILILLSKD